ncbi:glycosyltransferase family 2 protein [Flavobacterium daemonense]|uniref:glycosyltransferase family 2 protein n=1 Tax=Flavobacterium daemonense TaxID=1393049 RepID=UPI001185B918|nr:glycosyltransferase family 2 protein [Flavobacterium daemonense]KAF2333122.1 glycosyltransferase [Flavobacterium daemonense]
MSKISIITINYNNLDGLKRTVESVINQTWQEFEYIIIDGGSIDGSAKYIESLSDKIDYWVSEPDKGIYNAMNKGIAKATGDYLIFLNSGDHFNDSRALERNHEFLKDDDIIYFDINYVGNDFNFVKTCPDKLTFSFFFNATLPHQSVFIRKSLFEKIGYYDEKMKIAADWKFFMLSILKEGATYKRINSVLSTYYLDGISSRIDFSAEWREALVENFGGFVADCEELLSYREVLKTNRYKMLGELEKTKMGRKLTSIFFRTYIVLFSNKKLKEILIRNS